MSILVARSSRRFLFRHPLQLALALAGIAAGVAVVTGVDLANASAERAFLRSAEIVTGRATHQLVAPAGLVPESLYVHLRTRLGIRRAAPVVEAGVELADFPGEAVTLLGLDPLAEASFRDFLAPGAAGRLPLSRLFTEPGTVVLPSPLADRLSITAGETVDLAIGGRRMPVEVIGIVSPDRGRAPFIKDLVLADIATAQELLGVEGSLSRIDLILDEWQAEALAASGLGTAELVPAAARNRALVEMTRAFRTNLTALSLLALLVGAFLIYSTMAFLVVRRRRLLGLLRVLGVSRAQLFRVVFAEAAVIGALGTILGLMLGVLLGSGLVVLVTRTIADLYYDVSGAPLWINAASLSKGLVPGLAVSLLGAYGPAREAAASPPRAVLSRASMEAHARKRQLRMVLLAIGSTLVAAFAFFLSGDSLALGFFGLFCVIIAAALATPVATVAMMAVAGKAVGRLLGVAGSLAARSVVAGLSRTGVAVSALAVAVATVIGIGIMIASFRSSVAEWLDTTLRADFYVSAEAAHETALDDELATRLADVPGVRGLSRTRRARVPVADGELRIWAIDPGPSDWRPRFVAGDPASAWARFAAGKAALISEPLARRRGIAVGDEVPAPGGAWPVAGVFVDYTTEHGVVALALDAYRAQFADHALSGLGVYLQRGVDAEAVRRELASSMSGRAGLQLASSREIRAASLEIFERTFTVTEVLRFLAGFVALLGIYSALQALALERRREIAILRAVGFTPAQVRNHVLAQTTLLGLSAAAVALPLGVVLAWILVRVINERAFGWSMGFELAPAALWQGAALALASALLAGLRPAYSLARGAPARYLREE